MLPAIVFRHAPTCPRGSLFRADRVFCADHFVGGRWDNAGARRIADEIQSRQQRQARLSGQPDRPVDYTVVVEEAALRKVVGDHSIMRAQLHELPDFAGATAVTLRVLPETASAQIDTDGGMTILEFPDPRTNSPMMFAHYPGGVVAEYEPRVVAKAQRRFDAVLATALPELDALPTPESTGQPTEVDLPQRVASFTTAQDRLCQVGQPQLSTAHRVIHNFSPNHPFGA